MNVSLFKTIFLPLIASIATTASSANLVGGSEGDANFYQYAADNYLVVRHFADQGETGYQTTIGVLHLSDDYGISKDFKTAYEYLLRGSQGGDPVAQYNLAQLYRNGDGTNQSDTDAFNWMQKAASNGLVKAQRMLGAMYFNGTGTNQDYVYAYMWLNIAIKNGGDYKNLLKIASDKMTINDISLAQQLTRDCIAKKYDSC